MTLLSSPPGALAVRASPSKLPLQRHIRPESSLLKDIVRTPILIITRVSTLGSFTLEDIVTILRMSEGRTQRLSLKSLVSLRSLPLQSTDVVLPTFPLPETIYTARLGGTLVTTTLVTLRGTLLSVNTLPTTLPTSCIIGGKTSSAPLVVYPKSRLLSTLSSPVNLPATPESRIVLPLVSTTIPHITERLRNLSRGIRLKNAPPRLAPTSRNITPLPVLSTTSLILIIGARLHVSLTKLYVVTSALLRLL